MDLKENFVLFFNAAQLPRSCCWRNSTLAYLKAFYSSQLPWVPSSRTLKEFLTRDEIIIARDDEVLFVHLVAAIILFYFSFLKFVVSILICYFFLVAFLFLKSGAHLVFIGIESPQRSRVLDESRCALRERERERESTTDRNRRKNGERI
jgi:hypothetical protein